MFLPGHFFRIGDLKGIHIFEAERIEEAEALTNTDPAIETGALAIELKEWYRSARLMAMNDIHMKLAKKGVIE